MSLFLIHIFLHSFLPSHSSQWLLCPLHHNHHNRLRHFPSLPDYCSIFFAPSRPVPRLQHSIGCNHIHWTVITPLLPFLSFAPLIPSFSQGGSRLLRQQSREIACYRGSIFHALVNCFVLTLCQSGVVTPARATSLPTVTLLILGCIHREWGCQRCVCVCVLALIFKVQCRLCVWVMHFWWHKRSFCWGLLNKSWVRITIPTSAASALFKTFVVIVQLYLAY